jgi:hypothetical protein
MSVIFRSASCVQEACDAGLQLAVHNSELYKMIGSCASIPALERAFHCGLRRSSDVCRGAAVASALVRLKWLHLEQGCPLDSDITKIAAQDGELEMLAHAGVLGTLAASLTGQLRAATWTC